MTRRSRLASKPLAGRRIAVTRPAGQAEALVEGLRRLGAEALSCPTVRIEDPPQRAPLERAAAHVSRYDWIVFTSANGVARFFDALQRTAREGATARLPAHVRVAAIGPATARALEARGVRPSVVPEEHVAEAVADALVREGAVEGSKVLLPRAAGARRVLPERLRAAGAEVDEVVAYVSRPDPEGIAALRDALARGDVDMVTFTAASTVRHFVEAAGPALGSAKVAVIGPVTAAAARSAGLRVDAEAREYTVEGLLRAICDYFSDAEGRT